MAFNKKDLEIFLRNAILLDGFKFGHDVTAFYWQKEADGVINRIEVGYRKYPGSFYLHTPLAMVKFNEMEDIIHEYIQKYGIENSYGEYTIQSRFRDLPEVDYSKFDIEIHDEASFNEVVTEVNKIIEYGAMPFFEKFKTLQDVNKSLNEMDEVEISRFVSGIVGIKIPLIKKLINASDFKDELLKKKEWYIDREEFKNHRHFKDHDLVFNDLFSEDLREQQVIMCQNRG
ncbi:hypothetical protein FGO68_gene10986 [Halteria grandinella]|uniref:Uncharacterized protein n=1 Tax=Halteria grandinella TaxID=5974 RepID=A0A8J8NAX3_HALGN|nr:hypothetical protein FGO68_gene10986 [Halteria grandinella]